MTTVSGRHADPRKGRGAGINPEGRFEKEAREAFDDGWERHEEDLPPLRTHVTEERVKSIVSRNNSPDIPFTQSVNPYQGCEHGCVYCLSGDTPILMYVFYQQSFGMDTSQQQQQLLTTLGTPSILGQQVLDIMSDEVLVRQEAAKLGITVLEEELNGSIQEVYEFFPNGTLTPTLTSTPFSYPTLSSEQLTLYPSTATPTTAPTSTAGPTNTPDPSATTTATATPAVPTPTFVPEQATATSTPYTLEGFNSQYQKTVTDLKAYNVSEATLRSVYEIQLLREKLLEELTKDIPKTEEQVWARHILLDDETKAKATRDLLLGGLDFAKLAMKESKDTGSGPVGGDLGWFGRGAMVAPFEEAAFSQKIGEIGEIVKSDFGYHIIQVLGKPGPSADERFAKAAVADRVSHRLSFHEQEGEEEERRAGKR